VIIWKEVFKNLVGYRAENNLDYQNNYIGRLKIINNVAENFDILATSLNVLHNYFDSLIKLFIIYI